MFLLTVNDKNVVVECYSLLCKVNSEILKTNKRILLNLSCIEILAFLQRDIHASCQMKQLSKFCYLICTTVFYT